MIHKSKNSAAYFFGSMAAVFAFAMLCQWIVGA